MRSDERKKTHPAPEVDKPDTQWNLILIKRGTDGV
jgi:hypothetical protein